MKFVCFTAAILAAVLEEQSNAFILNKAQKEEVMRSNQQLSAAADDADFAQRWTETYGDLQSAGLSLSEIDTDIENNAFKVVEDLTDEEDDDVQAAKQGSSGAPVAKQLTGVD